MGLLDGLQQSVQELAQRHPWLGAVLASKAYRRALALSAAALVMLVGLYILLAWSGAVVTVLVVGVALAAMALVLRQQPQSVRRMLKRWRESSSSTLPSTTNAADLMQHRFQTSPQGTSSAGFVAGGLEAVAVGTFGQLQQQQQQRQFAPAFAQGPFSTPSHPGSSAAVASAPWMVQSGPGMHASPAPNQGASPYLFAAPAAPQTPQSGLSLHQPQYSPLGTPIYAGQQQPPFGPTQSSPYQHLPPQQFQQPLQQPQQFQQQQQQQQQQPQQQQLPQQYNQPLLAQPSQTPISTAHQAAASSWQNEQDGFEPVRRSPKAPAASNSAAASSSGADTPSFAPLAPSTQSPTPAVAPKTAATTKAPTAKPATASAPHAHAPVAGASTRVPGSAKAAQPAASVAAAPAAAAPARTTATSSTATQATTRVASPSATPATKGSSSTPAAVSSTSSASPAARTATANARTAASSRSTTVAGQAAPKSTPASPLTTSNKAGASTARPHAGSPNTATAPNSKLAPTPTTPAGATPSPARARTTSSATGAAPAISAATPSPSKLPAQNLVKRLGGPRAVEQAKEEEWSDVEVSSLGKKSAVTSRAPVLQTRGAGAGRNVGSVVPTVTRLGDPAKSGVVQPTDAHEWDELEIPSAGFKLSASVRASDSAIGDSQTDESEDSDWTLSASMQTNARRRSSPPAASSAKQDNDDEEVDWGDDEPVPARPRAGSLRNAAPVAEPITPVSSNNKAALAASLDKWRDSEEEDDFGFSSDRLQQVQDTRAAAQAAEEEEDMSAFDSEDDEPAPRKPLLLVNSPRPSSAALPASVPGMTGAVINFAEQRRLKQQASALSSPTPLTPTTIPKPATAPAALSTPHKAGATPLKSALRSASPALLTSPAVVRNGAPSTSANGSSHASANAVTAQLMIHKLTAKPAPRQEDDDIEDGFDLPANRRFLSLAALTAHDNEQLGSANSQRGNASLISDDNETWSDLDTDPELEAKMSMSSVSRTSTAFSQSEEEEFDDLQLPTNGHLQLRRGNDANDADDENDFDSDGRSHPTHDPSSKNWDDVELPEGGLSASLLRQRAIRGELPSAARAVSHVSPAVSIPLQNVAEVSLPPELERLRQKHIEQAGDELLLNEEAENGHGLGDANGFGRIQLSRKRTSTANEAELLMLDDLPVDVEQERKALAASLPMHEHLDSQRLPSTPGARALSKANTPIRPAVASAIRSNLTTPTAGTTRKDFASPVRNHAKPKQSPTLISDRTNRWNTRRNVSGMEFDPVNLRWVGNDDDESVKKFDRAAPTLISNCGQRVPRVVGQMVFDPIKMCWTGNDDVMDAFAGMDDLTEGL
ncbi:hypothetical protein, variant [Capsaspora owczarzaki ATCC 30864]|uniref:Uncharacterized protein n=1 Tax=Capsaspora owczarzaki (strain ATCC 30864) TaxID=595528 RepID=A0A0D2WPK6_CAPO3|nr:hypothetical protein, variant [Capsaspora owczarzaki ATCC 30864]